MESPVSLYADLEDWGQLFASVSNKDVSQVEPAPIFLQEEDRTIENIAEMELFQDLGDVEAVTAEGFLTDFLNEDPMPAFSVNDVNVAIDPGKSNITAPCSTMELTPPDTPQSVVDDDLPDDNSKLLTSDVLPMDFDNLELQQFLFSSLSSINVDELNQLETVSEITPVMNTTSDLPVLSPSDSESSSPATPTSCEEWTPEKKTSRRRKPYSKMSSWDPARKERKRGQNKTAATRYRQKKKAEDAAMLSEMETLEKNKEELLDKLEKVQQEVNILKDLIGDVYMASGLISNKHSLKIEVKF